MLRPDIYYIAYERLYSNNGASTKGVNDDTADSFSENKINRIIKMLADESYTPNPVRRTYITKINGKLRPLGIPTFTDKLVQEVLRMILEMVYEPIFKNTSHGFRPNRSCHSALEQIQVEFTGARWFIEGDIKGCFDNINHNTLVNIINEKIKDARLVKLIYKFLKAGYLEDWKYNNTYSGTPQGGIVSPILTNIYLHELDEFVENLIVSFNKPSTRLFTTEYQALANKIRNIKYHLKKCNENNKAELIEQLKITRSKLLKTPCKSQTDKKMHYVRYADDFIISVNGSKEDCEMLKSKLTDFIANSLEMQLSEEKTLITHSNTHARFLGYDIKVRRNNQIKPSGNGHTKRTLSGKVELNIPLKDKIEKFLFNNEIVLINNNKLTPCARVKLLHLSDLEIVNAYNSELRGICNYYNMASNFYLLNYFQYLMEYSCLKTLASKHKSSISKIIKNYRDGKSKWCIPYETTTGKKKMYFAKYNDCKSNKNRTDVISNDLVKYLHSRSKFEDRLKAKICELCGSTDSKFYEIHHINKVKNLKGKALWEQIMIAKRRKTIVVCRDCHKKIHGKK